MSFPSQRDPESNMVRGVYMTVVSIIPTGMYGMAKAHSAKGGNGNLCACQRVTTQSVPFIGLVGLTFKDGAQPVPPLECSDFVTNVRLSSGTPSLSGIIRRLPPQEVSPQNLWRLSRAALSISYTVRSAPQFV